MILEKSSYGISATKLASIPGQVEEDTRKAVGMRFERRLFSHQKGVEDQLRVRKSPGPHHCRVDQSTIGCSGPPKVGIVDVITPKYYVSTSTTKGIVRKTYEPSACR